VGVFSFASFLSSLTLPAVHDFPVFRVDLLIGNPFCCFAVTSPPRNCICVRKSSKLELRRLYEVSFG
jgi:hypothetical protein